MRRVVALVVAGACALAATAIGPAPAARADKPRDALRALLQGVVPEVGVQVGNLSVVPLLRDGDAPSDVVLTHAAGAEWTRVPTLRSDDLAKISAPLVARGGERPIAVAGRLLAQGDHERLLSRGVAGFASEDEVFVALRSDGLTGAAPPAPVGGKLGAIAPLTQRKLSMLGTKRTDLETLQRIQAFLFRVDEAAYTVAAMLESPPARKAVADRAKQLGRIPGAYAGRTVGHVAFFGHRPMEVVLCANGETYRELAPAYLESLAVSHALWDEAVGGGVGAVPDADLRKAKGPAKQVLAALRSARPKKLRLQRGESGQSFPAYSAVVDGNGSGRGFPLRFALRVTTDGAGAALLLEVVENGRRTVYPPPLDGPGGRPGDERPDIRGNVGEPGEKALERMLDRMRENRQRAGK